MRKEEVECLWIEVTDLCPGYVVRYKGLLYYGCAMARNRIVPIAEVLADFTEKVNSGHQVILRSLLITAPWGTFLQKVGEELRKEIETQVALLNL